MNGGTIDNAIVGKTNPGEGWFSPACGKGPAIITTFAGTVTAAASTTVAFSSAADAIIAGYSATNPVLGTTLISNALTRYIVSWTNSTTCVVDSAVTWAGTAITSVQLPISSEVTSAGVLKKATFADGMQYIVGLEHVVNQMGIGTAPDSRYPLSIYGTGLSQDWGIQLATIATPSGGAGGLNFGSHLSTTTGVIAAATATGNIAFWTYSSSAWSEKFRIANNGNIFIGGLAAAGTSAAKNFVMGSGTLATATVADAVHLCVADFLGATGDARLHIMGEASAAGKTVLGSGKETVTGTTGGFTRGFSEATVSISAAATCTIQVNVPATARILGCQLRVDTALTAGELWDAAYSGGSTDAICSGQAVAQNTKVNSLTSAVVTSETDIAITKNGGGSFTAAGVIRAIVYYEYFETMASL